MAVKRASGKASPRDTGVGAAREMGSMSRTAPMPIMTANPQMSTATEIDLNLGTRTRARGNPPGLYPRHAEDLVSQLLKRLKLLSWLHWGHSQIGLVMRLANPEQSRRKYSTVRIVRKQGGTAPVGQDLWLASQRHLGHSSCRLDENARSQCRRSGLSVYSKTTLPLLPPLLRARRMLSIRILGSTLLHMS